MAFTDFEGVPRGALVKRQLGRGGWSGEGLPRARVSLEVRCKVGLEVSGWSVLRFPEVNGV